MVFLMGCQHIKTRRIIINKDKNIGRVIYVVEGEKKEFNLLKLIFTKIFDYSFVEVKGRNKLIPQTAVVYKSKKNINSKIFVVESKNSNIKSVKNSQEYIDNIYKLLFEEFGLDPKKASIYYLFDRDRGSNSDKIILELICELKNAIDNGVNQNGLLLLSYPSIESFVISCFKSDSLNIEIKSNKIKKYLDINKIYQDQIDENAIIQACNELIKTIKYLIDHCLSESDFDDFEEINKELFNNQELYYKKLSRYCLLSLLIISLLDLKLIEIETNYEP